MPTDVQTHARTHVRAGQRHRPAATGPRGSVAPGTRWAASGRVGRVGVRRPMVLAVPDPSAPPAIGRRVIDRRAIDRRAIGRAATIAATIAAGRRGTTADAATAPRR